MAGKSGITVDTLTSIDKKSKINIKDLVVFENGELKSANGATLTLNSDSGLDLVRIKGDVGVKLLQEDLLDGYIKSIAQETDENPFIRMAISIELQPLEIQTSEIVRLKIQHNSEEGLIELTPLVIDTNKIEFTSLDINTNLIKVSIVNGIDNVANVQIDLWSY